MEDRRLDVLRSIPDADPAEYVRGQYEGYTEEDGVRPGSDTETFAALRLRIDNWRWAGVPFLIRAGKAMKTALTEVHVLFHRPPPILLGDHTAEVHHHNHISIRIGKDAGASIGVLVKDPSSESAAPVHLDVSFAEYWERAPEPYERLLGDALVGDPTLFPRQDVIEELWRIVQPLLDDPPPIERYREGVVGTALRRPPGRAVRWLEITLHRTFRHEATRGERMMANDPIAEIAASEGQREGVRWALSDPEETTSWERVRPRDVTDDQWRRFEDAVGEMFTAFGMDLETEGTAEHAASVRASHVRGHGRLRRGSQAADRLPDGMSRRTGLRRSAR